MLTQNDIYPTRGDQERLTERKDPIVYGRSFYHKPLNKEELTNYEHNGFVIIPDVFTASEVASLKRILAHLKQRNPLKKRREHRQNPPPGELESLFSPEKASTFFLNLAQERRILDRMQQILGGPLYLHRSRIHIEDGTNGTSYPWHSEFETWHAEDGIPRMRGAEAWVMLTESTPANGAMRMLAKSHYIYAACQGRNSPSGHEHDQSPHVTAQPSFEALSRLFYFGELTEAYGTPGTLVICDSNLMYGSTKGAGTRPRVTAMFSYNSMENLPADRPFASDKFRSPPLVTRNFASITSRAFNFEPEIERVDAWKAPGKQDIPPGATTGARDSIAA